MGVQKKNTIGTVTIGLGSSLDQYANWPSPSIIIADGPYGVSGYPGDPATVDGLGEWYKPHIKAWSECAKAETTLWFWGTELSWATVHPAIVAEGWEYVGTHIWNKGIAHIAGNVNGQTIRRFPVVTEVCVQYIKTWKLLTGDNELLPIKEWLRKEWQRSGLPLNKTNEAAGVKNAASRKYFTLDHLWYFPPADVMEKVAKYANTYGKSTQRPYFSLDGSSNLDAKSWSAMRSKWNHIHGVTNVWDEPAVRGEERLKIDGKVVHTNQKPRKLMKRIIEASSHPGDIVWEPFGGLCTGGVAAMDLERICYCAEITESVFEAASIRLTREYALFLNNLEGEELLENKKQLENLNPDVLTTNQQMTLGIDKPPSAY